MAAPRRKGYNGNALLKKAGEPVNWTKTRIAEYMKCKDDPIYFTEKYVKIIHVDKGLVPFKLYDYQSEMISTMADNRFTIMATGRQVGKSTTTVAFLLWYILFNSEKTVALQANKGDTAREILSRVQLAYQHLPNWMQQGVIEWNKGSFELENNSRILASTTSSDAIRGYSINVLFIDEAAYIDNWEEFFTSVFPTISSGQETKVIMVSTPNGLNHYYKLWTDSVEGRNSYKRIEVDWTRVPGRTQKWKDEMLASMGGDHQKFAQEHEVEWIGSSSTLIESSTLKSLVHNVPMASKLGYSVYDAPVKDRVYVCVADVSRGRGLDYSAFQVIDVTAMPYKQVASFRDNTIAPVEFAEILYRTGTEYIEAMVLVEINDIGGQVVDLLRYEYEYENLIATTNKGHKGKTISSGFGQNVDMGIRTTTTVKNSGCSILKLLLEQQQLIVHDYNTIAELATFSKKGHSYEAEPGNHDDLVMCLVLFAWLTGQQYFRDLTDINTMSMLRERNRRELEEDMLPFGFILDGHDYGDDPLPEGFKAVDSW